MAQLSLNPGPSNRGVGISLGLSANLPNNGRCGASPVLSRLRSRLSLSALAPLAYMLLLKKYCWVEGSININEV